MPLHDAAWSGNSALVQYILDEASSRNKISHLDHLKSQNNMGETPLHIASKRGHPHVVRLLLHIGDTTGVRDERGKLAHEASQHAPLTTSALHPTAPCLHSRYLRSASSCTTLSRIADLARVARQVAKNRRTFLAFPETADPIDRQLQQVGAMPTDRLLPDPSPVVGAGAQRVRPAGRHSTLQAGGSADGASPPVEFRAATAAAAPASARPGTSDVGNYTQSLGIRPK